MKKQNKKKQNLRFIHPKKKQENPFKFLIDRAGEVMGEDPQLQMRGNREAIVDGCKGILEYDEEIIRVTTGRMSIRFMGKNLSLKCLNDTSAIITGYIQSVEFFGNQ